MTDAERLQMDGYRSRAESLARALDEIRVIVGLSPEANRVSIIERVRRYKADSKLFLASGPCIAAIRMVREAIRIEDEATQPEAGRDIPGDEDDTFRMIREQG